MDAKDILKKFEECKTPLEYSKFEKYYIGDNDNKGQQWIFKFENGYGASIIKHFGSYGFEDDLFELAVIYFEEDFKSLKENKWHLSYNTPITNDVIGYLSNDDVLECLQRISELNDAGK